MNKQKFYRILPLICILGLLLSPLYMYFSHDVSSLRTQNPPTKGKGWVKLTQVSPFAKSAIVLTEDWGFYQHEGVDVNQIKIAINEMISNTRVRGASTITQQMVKNVFLSEDRTLWRKVHEIILAQKVEKVLSKNRILEIYLNVIEFGPGIYGIKDSSWHYFKKEAQFLSPRESAFLAMLLPSPKRYYRSFRQKRLTTFALKRITEILAKMRMGKVISVQRYEAEIKERFSWER